MVEAGDFALEVGHHSRDLPLSRTVSISAPSLAPPITRDSTLDEWGVDPRARRLLQEAIGHGGNDPFADPAVLAVIGSMPMSTLAAFPAVSIDHETLDELARRWAEGE